MPKGLPDSITYTMGKRVMRVARDKNSEKLQNFEDGVVVGAMAFWGTIKLAQWALWVLFSPIILLGWLAEKELARMNRKQVRLQRQARYQMAVTRRKAQS